MQKTDDKIDKKSSDTESQEKPKATRRHYQDLQMGTEDSDDYQKLHVKESNDADSGRQKPKEDLDSSNIGEKIKGIDSIKNEKEFK